MAGHSHWKQIQYKKGTTDQKRSKLFSKLLNAIAVAAKKETNPQFNPRLRTAIEKARENNVPQENIERAIKKAGDQTQLEELILEAYGPGGTAILIEAITDNKNRTISEIKTILKSVEGKWAEPGSVRWAFRLDENQNWQANFNQTLSDEDKTKLQRLIQELENHDDVQKVFHNSQP